MALRARTDSVAAVYALSVRLDWKRSSLDGNVGPGEDRCVFATIYSTEGMLWKPEL